MTTEQLVRPGTEAAAATPDAVLQPVASDLRRSLQGHTYADQSAMVKPGGDAQASAPALQSPRFSAVDAFVQVLSGARLLRWGNCNGPATFAVQGALEALGHTPGPVDGWWGPRTNTALLAYQKEAGLSADGVIGPLTLGALDKDDHTRGGTGGGVGGGPAGTTADPNLKHQNAGTDANPVDPERSVADAAWRLPFVGVDAGSGWDGEAILRRWTQVDLDPLTATDAHRCATNAVLASRILTGPSSVASYAEHVAQSALMVMKHISDPVEQARMQAKVTACGLAAAQVRFAAATYHTLDVIADAIKALLTNNPQGGTTGGEAATLNQINADERDSSLRFRVPYDETGVNELCNGLHPGEAWLVQVDTDTRDDSAPDDSQVDHFVTVGCTGGLTPDQGGVYLYDPWPRQGSQLIRKDKDTDAFWAYFKIYDAGGRKWKYSEWVSRTDPKA